MGNVVQCCQALSDFFRCKDTPVQGEAERSPLLSSEDSECESPSLPDDSEDELLTASDGVTNPALQPEHFLFPDIILSSNLGGEVTLVEPMVCLLVSEEEEGLRVDEPGGGDQERSHRWRSRACTEVETQTEAETQIGLGVQTQTEAEVLVCDAVEGEANTLRLTSRETDEDVWQEPEERRQVETQTAQDRQKRIDSENWADVEVFAEAAEKMEGQTEKDKPSSGDKDKEKENHIPEKPASTSTTHTLKTEQNTELKKELNISEDLRLFPTPETVPDPNTEPESGSVIPAEQHNSKNDDAEFQLIKTSISTETGENFAPAEVQDLETVADRTEEDCVPAKCPPTLAEDGSGLNADRTEGLDEDQEETAGPHVEDEDSGTKHTLFLVDGLFLAAPHGQASPGQTADVPEDEQQNDADQWKLSVSDIIDLQETDFTVRIQPPATEGFELEVSGQMLVVELHQVLMEHEITCHRTCFSLQLGGVALDSLTELGCVQGMGDGALIRVVEDSYTVRDARLHLRHVRDLLRSLDPADAYNGVNCRSLSYLSFYTRGDADSAGIRRAAEKESADLSPPEFLLPGCKDRPLTPLQPLRDDWKPLQCLRALTMSSWNPPPGNRKMHGDLMYLNVLTMENRELNITSSTRGFYLNQSTAFSFNPKPADPKILCHSLVELLSQVSPAFRKTFSALQKKRVQQHPYERIAAPFQVFTWAARLGDHTLDCVRAEETHTSRMGQDEHTAGQSRDWNEELQRSRELSRNSLQERLHRERSLFKTNRDFVAAAARGVVAVIDGNVMPLNPGEEPHSQMFIWNNLFFSLGFDISEHYRPLGGDAAAHAAATCDLRGAQAYSSVDVEGLHTLGTAVVDYRGIRVIAQTIVPGILEKNQEQSVVYGSNDYGKTVFTHPRFLELLDKTSKPLRIQRHQVLDHSDSPVELCSGIETKGILGNDGRAYILDLLRTFPPDLNFQFCETEERSEVPAACQSFGYPRRHRHSLASLRPELIDAFVQHRCELYVQQVSQGLDPPGEREETTEPRTGEAAGADTVFQRESEAAGSVSGAGFQIRFNPDVCSPGVRFPSECVDELQRQRQLLWDAAAFLLTNQIPAALRDCLDQVAVPMDGASLTSVLHQRGVNIRYLGVLLRQLEQLEDRDRLGHVQRISVSELVIRSAKHNFRTYLQDVEPAAFSAAVSHFLNCLLSSSSCFPDSCSDELLSRRRSKRRRSHGGRVATVTDSAWARLTASELWGRIRAEAAEYYHYTIHSENMDELIQKHNLQRISLLREIAIKTGIQVQLREYVFESRHRPAFGEEDVVNMFPVVKHLKPTASDATRLVQHAQVVVQQGLLRDGLDLIRQALTLFSSVCGVLHQDVCVCLRLLGRLCYILGEYSDALGHQEKAVLSSERTSGIDHPQTVQDYTHLALYCFAAGRPSTSLRLLYRARYLTLLLSGDDHPQVALLDNMLGLVLLGLMDHDLSLRFLQNALTLTSKFHGAASLRLAQCHHLLATVYQSRGEFRSALQHEKEAYLIYKSQVGENHVRTMESSRVLQSLTQQAVTLQRALNQIHGLGPGACAPPPQFSTPSFPTILQQLNLTCGIIVLTLSEAEMCELRSELRGKAEELEESLNRNLS